MGAAFTLDGTQKFVLLDGACWFKEVSQTVAVGHNKIGVNEATIGNHCTLVQYATQFVEHLELDRVEI